MSDRTTKSAQTDDAVPNADTAAPTPSERAVQFINSEVLNPPTQGTISFVKPYAEQVVTMALEDGRSFLQGVEQVLLVFIAKALEEALSGGSAAASSAGQSGSPEAGRALDAAERMMTVLPQFHASLAETALRFRKNGQ